MAQIPRQQGQWTEVVRTGPGIHGRTCKPGIERTFRSWKWEALELALELKSRQVINWHRLFSANQSKRPESFLLPLISLSPSCNSQLVRLTSLLYLHVESLTT